MGKCGCIKDNSFDFTLESNGCDALRYQDLSEWAEGYNYERPSTYDILMSINGPPRKVTVNVDGVTIITPEQMGFSESFPDTVVCVKTDSCEDTYIRYKLISCKVQCCLDQYVFKLHERGSRDSDYQEVERIQRLLLIAQRSAEVKNVDFAKQTLEAVKDAIEELNCQCKCK